MQLLFPKGGRYNGAKYPTCSETTLARERVSGRQGGTGSRSYYAEGLFTTGETIVHDDSVACR